ncbi:MAG TPA: hypothetical protein DEA43_02435 [Candidatus Moranbacteria bacterium]|nr:MAG: hypothetical protein UR95_C0001G0029 [Parcubacteria group bacterium GW2011_GWC1_36_108]KKQ00622.1 MAG: hypothetical protein US10_C0029G0008 [Candidatus Moranbacteria bacterium GW2011_GWD2_36_198]KKQ00715.1 MAG: hypothetical protein US09_C0007G0046 [Candidatus Moranbacteria bacterium GW2011_GWD1_36_198]KKQ40436.1 MAG: hypothetical protein US57_C0001G0046 [Candidatus Moranbacteria bacterium GW2011_GWC2_37_73]HAS00131.1 hypothetical protein [Candidatus Moranbacteria bacterium]
MKLVRKNKKGDLQINWICLRDKCAKNCCGAFEDPLPNFVSIEGQERYEIEVLPNEIKKLKNDCKDCIKSNADKGKSYMNLYKDHTCVLLKNGMCSKYEKRPSVCRSYPFYIDLFSGLNIDNSCPGVKKGWTNVSDLHINLSSLIKLYKSHIKNIEKKYVRK